MSAAARTSAMADQIVTFRLGREIFGIAILQIQEVLHHRNVTRIPNAPRFVEGVIDLRGRIIPVVDLRRRLGIAGEYDQERRIVILDLDRPLGIVVDQIDRVFRIDPTRHEPVPEVVIGDRETNCISSLAKGEDGTLVIVIEPSRILDGRERAELAAFEAGDTSGVGGA